MALTVWTKPSGYSFGTFQERLKFDEPLPVANDAGVTYTVISGALPGGLRISGNTITGTPYEVARTTEFSFCIRASKDNQIADRTFSITVEGSDPPEFITPPGDLDIGPAHQYFVLDSSYVDYQIEAIDLDTATGQQLTYFIASDGGELPPGLVLTEDGRIVGLVQPALAIRSEDGDGTYDQSFYDSVAYDFAYRPTNGYDSYIFDNVFYDYSLPTNPPKKLNRNYEFEVSVTDGDSVAKRKFKIFVVGDDYFRADNTTWLNNTGLFTADVTYLRAPIWLTRSDLGTYRANNYITLILDVYDQAQIYYQVEGVNADISAISKKRLITDNVVGSYNLTLTSNVMPKVGQWLSFTKEFYIAAWSSSTLYKKGDIVSNNTVVYVCELDHTSILDPDSFLVDVADGKWSLYPATEKYQISQVAIVGIDEYRLTLTTPLQINVPENILFYIGSLSQLPNGMSFDSQTGEVYGNVPYQPAITTTYRFTITASRFSDDGERASSSRMFTIRIIGEIDSVITWNTDPNLGTINANFISTLSVSATTTVPNSIVLYTLTEGKLPPGLTLDLDGEIVGKVNQYGNPSTGKLGLTTFDYTGPGGVTSFDGGKLTVDRVYNFTVQARDILGYSATIRTFTITIETPNEIIYSNIRTKPFLPIYQRNIWKDFINNTSVFTPESIYRPNDPSFGLQTELSMLVYAGIETTEAAKYVSAMGLNHKRKRFHFGDVKKAIALKPGTKTEVYEVVYVEMIDPLEPNGKRLPNKLEGLGLQPNTITADLSNIFWSRDPNDLSITAPTSTRPNTYMTVDSTGYEVSNPNVNEYFPNSISNWRDRLSAVGETERNYLPLWMRSIQPGTKQELGFTLAVPLCFCKVGAADDIVLNIKNYLNTTDFKFSQLDFTADRYIIDSVTGTSSDKYLVFRNDRITV